jgi:hypothetical protein
MIRLGDVIAEMVKETPLLQFGIEHKLFNLTQIARYLKPHIEVRTKKSVQISAIVMALSRYQHQSGRKNLKRESYRIKNITVHTGLATTTFTKNEEAHRSIHQFVSAVEKRHGYITLSEGNAEITVIYESVYEQLLKKYVTERPIYGHIRLASLGISFEERYAEIPGFIYIVLQQLMLQHINIIEIISTYTELVLLIDESETKVGFETLYTLFGSKK